MACGKCGFPIRENEPTRHYGFFSAHLESECLRLLKDRIAELTEQRDELLGALKAAQRHHMTTSLPLAIENYGGRDEFAKAGREVWGHIVPEAIAKAEKNAG